MPQVLASRAAVEKFLCSVQEPFAYRGFDACAGRPTDFFVGFEWAARDEEGHLVPNYRETVVSPLTRLNARQRAAALAIEHLLGRTPLAEVAIYATEATTSFFQHLRQRARHVVGSEYLGRDAVRGRVKNGVRHEDVTALTFGDSSFDLAVSNDVLEHVPDYRRGFGELLRVLRPGGVLLFTVPFLADQYDNVVRARVRDDGEIDHVLPPEYHGVPDDPDGRILCFQTFGWQLVDELRQVGYADAGALFLWSYVHGLLGRDLAVFFARKPEANETGRREDSECGRTCVRG